MKVVNKTPFAFQPIPSKVSPPERSVTLVLKGTFDLKPDSICTAASKQRPISPDQTYMDDIGRSLAWASDMAPFKPHTDFYIIGSFHQPQGVPAPTGTASFTLGPLQKQLKFFGPRNAIEYPDKTVRVNGPEPVTTVPLRWEYSFGGLGDRRNPMGLGIDPTETTATTRVFPLPQIEDPRYPIQTLADRPQPANFAPVPQSFLTRRRKLGTRDRHWSVFRAPLPPKDYDPSYHNAAPDDQQAGDYPHGNETLVLQNLHPTIPVLSTQLPCLRPHIGLLRSTDAGVVAEEVPLHLDTIVAMPDEDQLVLVWRGVATLQKDFMPDEVLLFQCEVEPLDEPPSDPGLAARMLTEYQEAEGADAARDAAADAQALAQMRKLLADAHLPPDLMKLVQTEADPMVIHEALGKYLAESIAALKVKYPHVATEFDGP